MGLLRKATAFGTLGAVNWRDGSERTARNTKQQLQLMREQNRLLTQLAAQRTPAPTASTPGEVTPGTEESGVTSTPPKTPKATAVGCLIVLALGLWLTIAVAAQPHGGGAAIGVAIGTLLGTLLYIGKNSTTS